MATAQTGTTLGTTPYSVQVYLHGSCHSRGLYTPRGTRNGKVSRLRLRLGRDLSRVGLLHHGSAFVRPPRAYCLASAMSRREQVYIFFPSSCLVSFPIPSSSINLLPLLSKHHQRLLRRGPRLFLLLSPFISPTSSTNRQPFRSRTPNNTYFQEHT